jgi:hypothetical protein
VVLPLRTWWSVLVAAMLSAMIPIAQRWEQRVGRAVDPDWFARPWMGRTSHALGIDRMPGSNTPMEEPPCRSTPT